VVDRLKLEYGDRVHVVWHAFELRPDPVPLPPPATPERRERWATSVLPMAAERGLEMRLPSVAPRTRLTHHAVEVARDHQRDDALRHAIFVAFFRDSRDIGDANVLADLGESVGVDRAQMLRALADGLHLAHVIEQEQEASRLGVTSVPAMLVGDDLATAEPVIGAVRYQWLKTAVDRALSGDSLEWRRRALKAAIPLKDAPSD
jgi:predicted DsbA family dithiol-disulfide isomerase